MPISTQVSLHGILEFGSWTALDDVAGDPTIEYASTNVYTLESFGFTGESGARVTPSVSTITQRSGQSAIIVDSFISEAGAQLEAELLSGTLLTLRRLLGIPESAHTGDLSAGTPTAETLIVRGGELGQEELSLYMKTMGPLGPRTYYFPRCKVASFPNMAHARTEYFQPSATFDLYENDAGEVMWIVDAAA